MQLALHGCEVIDVQSSAEHLDEFERLASAADATLPDRAGIRSASCSRRRGASSNAAAGCARRRPSSFGSPPNKQRTCERLAAAGVPVPAGIVLEPEAEIAGRILVSRLCSNRSTAPGRRTRCSWPDRTTSRRRTPGRGDLSVYLPGMAASVAFLCGPAGRVPLVPCRQRYQ